MRWNVAVLQTPFEYLFPYSIYENEIHPKISGFYFQTFRCKYKWYWRPHILQGPAKIRKLRKFHLMEKRKNWKTRPYTTKVNQNFSASLYAAYCRCNAFICALQRFTKSNTVYRPLWIWNKNLSHWPRKSKLKCTQRQ